MALRQKMVPRNETRTALDTVLRKELPLAPDLAADIPSICDKLRNHNP